MVTAFVFFLIGGALAEVIRVQLYSPQNHVVSESTYNQLFTMHGSIMLFLFLGPFAFGLANYLVPLQIGARDMAFPRLNAHELLVLPVRRHHDGRQASSPPTAPPTSAGPATRRCPRSPARPALGGDLWIMALVLTGPVGRAHRGEHRRHRAHDARARA